MNHEEYEELVSQYIDRELGVKKEDELFAHLSECKRCREFLRATWLTQVDIRSTKPRHNDLLLNTQAFYSPDRSPIHQTRQRSFIRSVVSTLVLFMLVSLIVGVLFSADTQDRRIPVSNGGESTLVGKNQSSEERLQ